MITIKEVKHALSEDNFYIIVNFINQQEKVNELLELYRIKINYMKGTIDYRTVNIWDIQNKIDELERELK